MTQRKERAKEEGEEERRRTLKVDLAHLQGHLQARHRVLGFGGGEKVQDLEEGFVDVLVLLAQAAGVVSVGARALQSVHNHLLQGHQILSILRLAHLQADLLSIFPHRVVRKQKKRKTQGQEQRKRSRNVLAKVDQAIHVVDGAGKVGLGRGQGARGFGVASQRVAQVLGLAQEAAEALGVEVDVGEGAEHAKGHKAADLGVHRASVLDDAVRVLSAQGSIIDVGCVFECVFHWSRAAGKGEGHTRFP